MSGLRDRLTRLKSHTPTAPAAIDHSPTEDWHKINCSLKETTWGSFIIREKTYSLHHPHGSYALGDVLERIQFLSPLIKNSSGKTVSKDNILFFDTETTGLGVGAGNVPFMIGIGYFQLDCFIVEQLFIRNPAEELAMLHYFYDKLQLFSFIATYNGKSFDWSILKNRFILNRIKFDDSHLEQLDLLYPARNLWKHTMPSCRLSMVEIERLGFKRKNDVPGSMAPTLYFQYLAVRDPELIAGVFDHNEYDILSLATLTNHYCKIVEGSLDLREIEAGELFYIAKWLYQLGFQQQADVLFQMLLQYPFHHVNSYLLFIAAMYKKRKIWSQATHIWKRMLIEGGNRKLGSIEPYIELAKYYEHKEKDTEQALLFAKEALELSLSRQLIVRGSNEKLLQMNQNIEKRVQRLQKKYCKK